MCKRPVGWLERGSVAGVAVVCSGHRIPIVVGWGDEQMNAQHPTLNAQRSTRNGQGNPGTTARGPRALQFGGWTAVSARGYSQARTRRSAALPRASEGGPPSLFELWRDSLLCGSCPPSRGRYGATRSCAELGGPQKPAICETQPFVMLKKPHLYGSERRGCIDYRKMTNGFVFLEMGGRGVPPSLSELWRDSL